MSRLSRKSITNNEKGSNESKGQEDLLSYKRFFINNVDSYHGKTILAEVAKFIAEKNTVPPSEPSTVKSVIGEDDVVERVATPPPEVPWEIIATVTDPSIKSIENVTRIIPKEESLPIILTCGTVIWDVSCDKDELNTCLEYLKLLNLLLEKQSPEVDPGAGDADHGAADSPNKRILILISTIMTWASTKPLDPETPELPFLETDFRKRKPHPNYRLNYDCENEVITIARKYTSQIGATVIGIGVTYGGQEDVLYYWFQKAWECERLLPILGRGSNIVPLINVQDLAQMISNLIADFPRKLYILAVEQNVTKQREIIKALGRQVGSGMFMCIPQEDAFLIPDITQRIYDLMTVNLAMEPTYIVETMSLNWVTELSFAEYVLALMKQFKKERGLRSYKIVIYGPPIVGKTPLAKQVAKNYGVVYVSPDTVVEDLIEELTWRIEHRETGEMAAFGLPMGGEDDDPVLADEEEEGSQEADKSALAILQSGRTFTEDEIIGYLRQRLLSHMAQNKGYVLDGFPTTLPQCAALFERGEEEDEVDEEQNEAEQFEEDVELYANVLKKLLPDLVVSLEATDEFICEKAMRQPECESRLEEEAMLRRLSDFRAGDTMELTPMNFFDELDIHPLVLNIHCHNDYAMNLAYKEVALRLGRPCRYPALLAAIEEDDKKQQKEIEAQRVAEQKALEEMEKKIKEEREDRMEYWSDLYALLREEEEAALAAASEPMRNYLISHIFPTLTPALLEVAKIRPEDPVDYLAEYLFKLNPTGKMLEPGFNLQAEIMLGKVKVLDEALKSLDIKIDPLLPPEVEDPDSKKEKKQINPMSAF